MKGWIPNLKKHFFLALLAPLLLASSVLLLLIYFYFATIYEEGQMRTTMVAPSAAVVNPGMVERSRPVNFINLCKWKRKTKMNEGRASFEQRPKTNIFGINWTKSADDEFWVFSAFLDIRRNSLFPSVRASVQVQQNKKN